MKNSFLFIVTIVLLFITQSLCKSKPTETTLTPSFSVDTFPVNKPAAVSKSTNHLGRMFNNKIPFQVISAIKETTDKYTGDDDITECKSWNLTEVDIIRVIKNSENIDGTTWDLAFAFTSCELNGQLKQNNEIFSYSINAGSWFRIACRDTVMLFGNFNKRDRKYFLYPAKK